MRVLNPLLPVLAVALALPAAPRPAAPSRAKTQAVILQLQAQVKKLTEERDGLKDRLAATESLQEDLAAAQKSRDLARQDTDSVRKELDQLKSSLADNQGSTDTILAELQKTKSELAAAQAANESLKAERDAAQAKLAAPTTEGALVPITPDITPAVPMNLNRVVPKAKKVSRGVVVVNVLISESGEVLDTRLLQGLPGHGEWVDKANAACVEAARRLVFDPARVGNGSTKVRVWQGVGFMLD